MNRWVDMLVDSSPISAIYGQDIPSLDCVDLHEIQIHRDGPRVTIRFNLGGYPARAPAKWVSSGFNTVQLSLMAMGVKELQVEGLGTECPMNLAIAKEGGLLRICATGEFIKLNVAADALILDGISAYRRERGNAEG